MSIVKSIYCLGLVLVTVLETQQKPAMANDSEGVTCDLTTAPAKNLKKTWYAFATAIMENDTATLKALSAEKIYCTDCITNTAEEELSWERYKSKNPDTWYDKLYKELSYLQIDIFVEEDIPVIFNTTTRSRLLNSDKLVFVENKKQQEVLVTIVDSSNKTEGMQVVFTFEKTMQGYRFCGYSTIP